MVTPTLRLVRALGTGGMGSVWVADHLALRTEVVVKFMAEELAKNEEAIGRFSREAAAAAQVKSPHVVQTLDHGLTAEGTPYIVMELLEGHDLSTHLEQRGGPLPLPEVVAVVAQLARALTKAHALGIVHRDIKPSNVFLCDSGAGELFVKLLDFGIAKAQALKAMDDTTRTGAFVGSPFYMSPEQVVGSKGIDSKSDLWSLGVVTFEMLTAKKPFFADTVGGLALKIHRDPLPLPATENPKLPHTVDAWFLRACAREPSDRFASAKEMADKLAVALTGERLTPSLSSDSGAKAPQISALAATTPAPHSGPLSVSTQRSGKSGARVADATDAGVGLGSRSVPSYLPSQKRGKIAVAMLIGVAALGLGFAVPRLFQGSAPPSPASTAVATTSAPGTGTAAATAATVTATAPSMTDSEPTMAVATAPPRHTAGAPGPTVAPPTASSVAPKATVSAKPPPPALSDDDIK